jgi:hypothetical protein
LITKDKNKFLYGNMADKEEKRICKFAEIFKTEIT